MKSRAALLSLLLFVAYSCATTRPTTAPPKEPMEGIASWYGEEFAGRTTANGEIFDPGLLTAAHRTLPFGTLVDVTNTKTHETVRVRINDRGPYIGNRMIDLSYAAAQQISLIEPGTGEVELHIVSLGRGDREPPAPYVVRVEPPKEKVVISSGEPPKIDFPLPAQSAASATPASTDADADFHVEVTQQKAQVETRRQVSADGRSIEDVPVDGSAPVPVTSAPGHSAAAQLDRRAADEKPGAAVAGRGAVRTPKYLVQVGAFSVEANAKALQAQLTKIGQQSFVDHDTLYRVRIGPFDTRDQAVKTRAALEAAGLSAMIVAE